MMILNKQEDGFLQGNFILRSSKKTNVKASTLNILQEENDKKKIDAEKNNNVANIENKPKNDRSDNNIFLEKSEAFEFTQPLKNMVNYTFFKNNSFKFWFF